MANLVIRVEVGGRVDVLLGGPRIDIRADALVEEDLARRDPTLRFELRQASESPGPIGRIMRRIEPPPSRASGGDFLAQPAPQIDLAPARCSWHWGGAGSERAWLTAISASPRKSRMAWLALDRGPTIFKQRWL